MRTAFVGVLLAGCAIGAPPGFSPGERWTFPLVDPLTDGRLVTPVTVDGRGPFLMAIDPDAPVTVMDRVVVGDKFAAHQGPRVIDEEDVSHPRFYIPVTGIQIGDLTISSAKVEVSDHEGDFDAGGQRIYGVLGKDVIADSLLFGFDRDRGIAWLETHDKFHPPTGATELPYHKGTNRRADLVIRRLVTARVGGRDFELHLDLGDVPSQLFPKHWQRASLATQPWHQVLVDETGTRRTTEELGIGTATVAGLSRDVGFVPFVDKRWELLGDIDGTLGLDFFRPYNVIADWDRERYYLTPRHDDEATRRLRLGRWGDLCASCVHAAVAVVPASPDATAIEGAARATVSITRDPGSRGRLEVVLAATSPSGTALPQLTAEMPEGVDRIEADVEPRYAGATLEVTDVSPFLRDCPTNAGCIQPDPPLAP